MIVDIDVGNSRIKWRTLDGGVVTARGAGPHFGEELIQAIVAQGSPERVRLSSVGSESVGRAVANAAARWDCPLQCAATTGQAGGVVCGYDDPAAMGVDRWLALLAARQMVQGACVVVDAGSAITMDLMDLSGSHLGGYILPGLSMIRHSLLGGTARIVVNDDVVDVSTAPGRTTQQAVVHGSLLMVSALTEKSVQRLATDNQAIKIIVTGGDGKLLLPVLGGDACYIDELVMDGLSVLFP